jgi:hypothetical protein
MKQDLAPTLIAEFKESEAQFTKLLRADARKAGWPNQIIKVLSVSVTEKGVSVTFPEEFAKAVDDLEYGTLIEAPRMLLRSFEEKHRDDFGAAIAEASLKHLMKEGALG